jgi:hypothetical protein
MEGNACEGFSMEAGTAKAEVDIERGGSTREVAGFSRISVRRGSPWE